MQIKSPSFALRDYLILLLVICLTHPTVAQDETPAFKSITVATGLSTLGFNLEVATPVATHFLLKAGFNTYSYNTQSHRFNLDDPYGALQEAFGQRVAYDMKAKIRNVHANLVVDYYPFIGGILYLSGGIYIGKTTLSTRGTIVNRDGSPAQLQPPYFWPELDFNGQKLDITNGRLDTELTLGNTLKPYIGLGLGRAVPKRRLGIKVEMGLLYAGEYSLKQNGVNLGPVEKRAHNFEEADTYIRWFKYYPMAKFQLQYRLF
ncbi:hypothetical protein [Myroides sp. DW712]|uniref:hypothetical protein n=1 Tax=Myroides sp. DW712 TaxID=3389800 RepID=UPI00397C0E60